MLLPAFALSLREALEELPVPNHLKMLAAHDASRIRGVIVTLKSPTDEHDFISRYFAPWNGISEDPVTGKQIIGRKIFLNFAFVPCGQLNVAAG